MDANDILKRLDQLLSLHFPDERFPNGPYWGQEPYRSDFFALCMEAYDFVSRDDVANHVRQHWNARRQHRLPSSDEGQLDKVVDAWGEWQYARRKLGVKL
jgi:hypothetical protein